MNVKHIRVFWITAISVFCLGFLGLFVVSLKQAQGEDLTKLLGIEQKLSAPIDKTALVKDEQGKVRPIGDFLSERPAVLMMIFYTCESACITETEAALKTFRSMKSKTIGKDFDVVTVSIHPRETPDLARAKKAEYTEFYNRPGAEKGWHFLTGDYDQVQKLAKSVGFKYAYNEKENRVVHPTGLMILTPSGKLSKYFMGTEYPARYFQDSIVAAGQNQIGSVSEPVTIGCFTFDPSTGKTFVTVQNALRLTGSLTVLILVFSIVSMVRREKQNNHNADTAAEA